MAPHRRPVVLVVDDHADTVELFAVVLRRAGYEVHTALSNRDALKTAIAYHCDLLVSDLHLPDGDGCDLLRAVCALSPVSAIAVTGLPDATARARSAGFGNVLEKPVSTDVLVAAVRNALIGFQPLRAQVDGEGARRP